LAFYKLSSYVIKFVHDDTNDPEQPKKTLTPRLTLKLRPRGDNLPKAKTKPGQPRPVRLLLGAAEHGGLPAGPELLQHSVAKPNELHVAAGGSLVPEPGTLSCSNPNATCSVGGDERAPKRASTTTKKPARKRRRSVLNTPRRTDLSQTLEEMTEGRTITEPDPGMDHTAAIVHKSHVDGGLPLPAFTFDNAGEKVLEEDVYPYDSTFSEYPVLSSIGSEKEQQVSRLPRPKLPVTPPIWAQVRRIVCEKDSCYMAPSLDRKCASPLTTSGVIKVASIIPMKASKDIFSGPTPPGQCIHQFIIAFI
jgi:hypothetical protein